MKIYESHDDDFAKIVRAESGRQVLVYCDSDDESGKPQTVMMTAVDGVTIKLGVGFNDTDDGYEARDKHFDGYDTAAAGKFEAMALGAVIGNQAAG